MFPCTQCGACCQFVGRNEITSHLDRGDGTCKYYLPASKHCGIYEDRPLCCRVDDGYDKVFKDSGMTREEFYSINLIYCKELQKFIP